MKASRHTAYLPRRDEDDEMVSVIVVVQCCNGYLAIVPIDKPLECRDTIYILF